jgi:hypothetical protein
MTKPATAADPKTHEHDFRLQLGADGHGQLYGNYEGYLYQCKCGEYRADFKEWQLRRDLRLAGALHYLGLGCDEHFANREGERDIHLEQARSLKDVMAGRSAMREPMWPGA